MSDLYLQALLQSLLGSPGAGSSEFQGLLAEVCRRFILNGVSINSSGIFSFPGGAFAITSITGTASRLAAFDGSGVGTSILLTDAYVDPAAAIAYSKLSLTNSIVNADIAAAAAIGWSKVSKAGSSLADLATRSASDLSSGNLPAAQLPSGAVSWSLTSLTLNGPLLFTADNAQDIGASGATRPRDLFLGRNASIGGTLAVTSTSAFTGQIATAGGVKNTPRVQSITSSAAPTPNADTDDALDVTALATAPTFGAPTGTPVNFQKLLIRIKDNGTARALAWNAAYVAGGVSLPTTTVVNKILNILFQYDTANALNKWQCIAVAQEA